MKISYINGICVKNDAISASVRSEILALSALRGVSCRFYTYRCDYPELPFKIVDAPKDILGDGYFWDSDIVVFHFGIYAPLFDVIFATPKNAKKLVVFHNVTPKKFLPESTHPTLEKSYRQMSNMAFADHVLCVSGENLKVLRESGVETPASVIPLGVEMAFYAPTSKPSSGDGRLRVAFVGRLVKSKGPLELTAALAGVLERDASLRIRFDAVGNIGFSDPAVVAAFREELVVLRRRFGIRFEGTLQGDASDELKHRILSDADLFVLPTYHEGFCVPVLEAYSGGCVVVTYDNSNLPSVVGDIGTLVATGDVAALTDAIVELGERMLSESWRQSGYAGYLERVKSHLSPFSPERVYAAHRELICNLTGQTLSVG